MTATSEEDVAAQFMSWFKNFADTFGTQGYKVYIAGESYAGMYVPYIASAMLDANDTTYYDVDGIIIYDPSIAYDSLQSEFTVFPFVEYWNGRYMSTRGLVWEKVLTRFSFQGFFAFNDTFMSQMRTLDEECGYAAFRAKYLVYPPTESLPAPAELPSIKNETCVGIYNDVFEAVSLTNPCFDVYQVATTCPLLWDVLGCKSTIAGTKATKT